MLNLEDHVLEHGHFSSSTTELLASSKVDADTNENFLSVGLEGSLELFRLQLTGSSSKLEMLGIVGMAGIGKTTLANMIFQDPSVIQHFDLRAWVKVSQSHNRSDMLLQVLKYIIPQKNYVSNSETEACLKEDIYRRLKGQRYMIVVDDLWSVEARIELRRPFPDDSTGSRLLFTSRQSNVITDLNCKMINEMSLLDEQASWGLLKKKVFGQDTCPSDLVDIGKRIASKCQGLPLAIVVIAGILKIKKKLENWQVIKDSFNSLVFSSTNPCQQIFALSYQHLPAHLKACFLYMGAFPGGGFEIESQVLSRLWIAEGIAIPIDSDNLEHVADEYLKDLIDKSLVLVASKRSNGNVKTCRLHDLFLEYCIKQARQDNFLDVIKDSKEVDPQAEATVHRFPHKKHSEDKGNRPHRFSFHCNTFEDIPPKSQARSALFTRRSREVPDILLYDLDFKSIVVLHMIPLRFDSFPVEQVSKLCYIKYLAFSVSQGCHCKISWRKLVSKMKGPGDL